MIKVNGYNDYFGGKSGNGTYQTIINHIPPHEVFYSLYLGNCGITRNIKPAMFNVLNDLDSRVIDRWRESALPSNYALYNEPAINILKDMQDGFYLEKRFERGFVYLDPPYRKGSRKSQADVYQHQLTDKCHSDLLLQIVAMGYHKIMISHYPDPMYNEALKDWQTHDFWSMTRKGLVLERIYYNYVLTDELHDYRYIGNDFREREALSRVKKNFISKFNALEPRLRNSIFRDLIEQKCDAAASHKEAVTAAIDFKFKP